MDGMFYSYSSNSSYGPGTIKAQKAQNLFQCSHLGSLPSSPYPEDKNKHRTCRSSEQKQLWKEQRRGREMEAVGRAAPQPRLLLYAPAARRSSSWPRPPAPARRRRWAAAAVAAEGGGLGGYERVPLGTPGAYRLVDRSTGRSVLVWGGTDDGDGDALPSPAAIALSTRDPKDFKGVAKSTGIGEFGRLKVQKVKALIRRSSQFKKEGSSDTSIERADTSHFDGSEEAMSDSPRRVKLSSSSNDKKSLGSGSVSVDSRRHKGDGDFDVPASRATPASSGWGNIADVTSGRQIRQKKAPLDSAFFSRKSFKDVGCTDDVASALRNLKFLHPSHIQAMAYGPVLEGKSCIIADQSGSGKTLAYLAPIVQSLRQEEVLGLGKSSPRSPRVIVLAPTAELASQVLNNCRAISKSGVPFRSMVATGGFRQKTQLDGLEQELDVLVATPGRFFYLLQEGFVQLSNLRCVVLDEVDILFGEEGFEQVLQRLITVAPVSAQYLFVTATLPVDIYNKVVELFPDCEVVMGPSVHRTSSRLEEVLVDCSGDDDEEKNPETAFSNKKSALVQIAQESPVPKTIVFCNKIETCRKVENVLRRLDRKASQIKVLPFHAALAQELRLANMKEFLSKQSADNMFLVCTDRASRGIDFANVDHVVLFDYPRDPSEYVRRVGRTARGAGGKGKAYVFVVGKQVSLARRVMERNKKGHPLHDVPCA